MQILIATSNVGKVSEISAILNRLNLDIIALSDIGIDTQVEESGTTYNANAEIKGDHFFSKTGLPTLAEDSGIVVDALKDELGVHTRRWGAGEQASDEEWIEYFMQVMEKHIDEKSRAAKFISHMYFTDGENKIHVVGETMGYITPKLEAPLYKGLPLSSCFRPIGFDKVYSALSENEKNQVSHRGKAGKQMADHLAKLLNDKN